MNILVVDDEKHNLTDLTECLSDLCPKDAISAFERGDEALAFARSHKIDVAFLDINMPVISGIDLAKELKKLQPFVNIIFCTAYSRFMAEAIRLHASGYITKPYEKKDVKRELENLLHPTEKPMPRVFVRTFGDFDLFIDGMPLLFRKKSKELLAYLIYKRGGVANKKEIGAVLFEDDYSESRQDYLKKIYKDLEDALKKHGVGDILVKGFNQYAVDVSKFACDLFDYDAGDPDAIRSYKGDFMTQYDWAEL